MSALGWHVLEVTKRQRSDEVRFGIFDDKRREVGCYIEINEAKESTPSAPMWFVRSYATRAGVQFGAAFPKPTCVLGDEAAAKALAAKKIEEARKRAKKNFGGAS